MAGGGVIFNGVMRLYQRSLLRTIEIYIDRKVLPQMNTMNAMYNIAETEIKKQFEVADNDEIISLLQEIVVDEDEYLRYRISERFNVLMKNLFDAHKKDALPDEQASVIQDMKAALQGYPAQQQLEEKTRWKMTLFAKQIGLNITNLSDEELRILMATLQKSAAYKQGRRQGKRR